MRFNSLTLFSLCFSAYTPAEGVRRSVTSQHMDERDLIVGGFDADPSNYPFFVFSRLGRRGGCGGTLIHTDIVLTAAHCQIVYEGRGLAVGASTPEGTGQFFEDEAILVHPNYDGSIELNDIMLVKLEGTSDVPVVPLNTDQAVPADGETVTIIGLGRTSQGGDLADVLQEVNVEAVDYDTCFAFWDGSVPIGDERQVCAGLEEGGRDACQTDSGGPILDTMGRQIGIVSLGDGCGQPNSPAVYTRVSFYLDFIREGICDLSSEPPSYCSPTSAPTPDPTPAPTKEPTPLPTKLPSVPMNGPSKGRRPPVYFYKGYTMAGRNKWLRKPYYRSSKMKKTFSKVYSYKGKSSHKKKMGAPTRQIFTMGKYKWSRSDMAKSSHPKYYKAIWPRWRMHP